MLQWISPFNGWLSIGVHLDFASRTARINGREVRYGPYGDVHFGWVIISLGVNPVYSGEFDSSVSVGRGGVRAG